MPLIDIGSYDANFTKMYFIEHISNQVPTNANQMTITQKFIPCLSELKYF